MQFNYKWTKYGATLLHLSFISTNPHFCFDPPYYLLLANLAYDALVLQVLAILVNRLHRELHFFLEELVSDFPITWLGALPDALKKVTPAEYKEILGEDIAPESFENFNCDITAANSRCYATVI